MASKFDRGEFDMRMLANDMADMLDKYGYMEKIGDLGDDDILPLLPEFVLKLRAAAAETQED